METPDLSGDQAADHQSKDVKSPAAGSSDAVATADKLLDAEPLPQSPSSIRGETYLAGAHARGHGPLNTPSSAGLRRPFSITRLNPIEKGDLTPPLKPGYVTPAEAIREAKAAANPPSEEHPVDETPPRTDPFVSEYGYGQTLAERYAERSQFH